MDSRIGCRVLICIVVAAARNGVIGRGGALPWRIPSDLKQFRRTTLGKPVIMGRKTWASLRKPLDGRDNLVVTRQAGCVAPGAEVLASIGAALERARTLAAARGADEIMVIGGAEIYREALPLADRIYLTIVDAAPEGDATFVIPDPAAWIERSRTPLPRGPNDEHATTLVVLERAARRLAP